MLLDGQRPDAIAEAARVLQRGDLLGLPTETVYGLAADAGNDDAVRKIYAAKGRPSDHPLIVHVANVAGVDHFAHSVPDFARQLMAAFWPGPLTLILPRREAVAGVAAGGQDSVGVRCPAHPVAHAVLLQAQALGVSGVAAPSANLFGRVSPTTAAHVTNEFGPDLCVIDGGACAVGIESTIVDCTRGAPVLLRPGMLTPEQLGAVCGMPVLTADAMRSDTPRASGTLASHYAPRAVVKLMSPEALHAALNALTHDAARIAVWSRTPMPVAAPQCHWRMMPAQAAACAQVLFAQLREFDALKVDQIWVEMPPLEPAWDGVRDRLMRAATPNR